MVRPAPKLAPSSVPNDPAMRPIPALSIQALSIQALSTLCLALLVAATLPTTVHAHETMPANWCSAPNQTPVIVSTFSFSPEHLQTMATQTEQQLGPEGLIAEGLAERMPDGRCGIVDRWNMATYIAQTYCPATSGHPDAIIHITGPQSYVGSLHHATYRYTEGLEGACVVCTTATTPILEGL